MSNDTFWLSRWLDDCAITDEAALRSALGSPKLVKRAIDYAFEVSVPPHRADYAIVAGRGVDFSMAVECGSSSCRREQVNLLFRRAWHYFDQIVVADTAGPYLRAKFGDASKFTRPTQRFNFSAEFSRDVVTAMLFSLSMAVLYLREIGAADLVIFSEKSSSLGDLGSAAELVGLEPTNDLLEQLSDVVEKAAALEFSSRPDGTIEYSLDHPDLTVVYSGILPATKAKRKSIATLRRHIIREFVAEHLLLLLGDVETATRLRIPLAATLPLHGQFLARQHTEVNPGDVVLNLALPVLDGVPTSELLRIRTTEKEAFERFRAAITTAIVERQKAASTQNAVQIAAEVEKDILLPALAEIQRRLKLAENILAKKATFGIALGAMATTCGLMAAVPPLAIGGAMAAIGAAAAAEAKYIDDTRDIQLHDMYFLWRAVACQ